MLIQEEVKEIYVWEDIPDYLCLTAEEAGSTIVLSKNGSPAIANTAYSTDGIKRYTYTPGTSGTLTLKNVGDFVLFRNDITGSVSSSASYLNFVMRGKIAASGNINSMYKATDFENITTLQYNFCLCNLFLGCTSLTTAPRLPATTLSSSCYSNMFNGCTSLKIPPSLPATSRTSLATSCYNYMFYKCTSLEALPKIRLSSYGSANCSSMFEGCTNIKLSTTKTGDYQTAYRIPTSGTGSAQSDSFQNMFYKTGGTFTGTPTINTTYYTSNTVV